MTSRNDETGGIDELFAPSRFVDQHATRPRGARGLLLGALSVAVYAATSGAVWGVILTAWPFWLDGAMLRQWAVLGLFPAGETVEHIVGLVRALTSMLTSSDAVAIGGALGIAFALSTLVTLLQGIVIATLVWLVAGLVARLRRPRP